MPEKHMHNKYFLQSSLAEELFHSYAKKLPIVDFHNHLNPKDLGTNRKFKNLADAWVLHDPYKHRVMRICGIPEKGITGSSTDKEKFFNWAETLPKTLGNPLFLWSANELKHIFGIDEILTKENALKVWDECNSQLQQEGFGAIDILKKFNTEILCTSNDFLDDLSFHCQAVREHGIKVFPSLRGDFAVNIEQPGFPEWLKKLENQATIQANNLDGYKSALLSQFNKFSEAGCRLADHSLDAGFSFKIPSEKTASEVFNKKLNGKILNEDEITQFKNHILQFLSTEYSRHGWTLQLHIGAQRYTSSRLRKLIGPAGGFAAIGNSCDIEGLCSFLDELEKTGSLPKIILFTLNPSDNEAFATITGSYSEDGVPGKIQFGPGWWYNDQYEGIRQQLIALGNYGLLSQFIGMTTDSRSVFSFSRHEYFRRILCNLLAEWVALGIMPDDIGLLGGLVNDVCYFNSKNKLFNNVK